MAICARPVAAAWLTVAAMAAFTAAAVAEQAPAPSPQPAIDSTTKRAVPDYDGRGEEPTSVGEVLIWVPRAVVFPVWLVAEYGLRYPLGWLLSNRSRAWCVSAARGTCSASVATPSMAAAPPP